jgi:signal transduction histidine kinase
MEAQPNLAIYPPPRKPRRPGARRVPLPIFIGLGLTFPVAAIGRWMAEHYWADPVPPDTSPPFLSLAGWLMVLGATLAFAILAIAAVVMLAESFYAGRALKAKTVEVAQLRASRGRLIDASDATRRELERDLHDGVQPRLVALLLNVSMARREGQFAGSPAVIDDIERELREILDDIRALASGILPPALTDLGLEAAVTELTSRMPFPVDVALPPARLPARAEVTAYFILAEALTNAAKHADPTHVTVAVRVRGQRVSVVVSDDG